MSCKKNNKYMFKLKEVGKFNYEDCIELELEPGQVNNLTSNAVTIAQSKYESHYRTRAVYKDNEVIGFLTYCYEDESENIELYWLFRFMFDREHQGRGYALHALKLLTDEIKTLGGERLYTMHKPSNVSAGIAYRKFGFKEIGVLEDGDIHLELDIM